jgi:hypothetical protein
VGNIVLLYENTIPIPCDILRKLREFFAQENALLCDTDRLLFHKGNDDDDDDDDDDSSDEEAGRHNAKLKPLPR